MRLFLLRHSVTLVLFNRKIAMSYTAVPQLCVCPKCPYFNKTAHKVEHLPLFQKIWSRTPWSITES